MPEVGKFYLMPETRRIVEILSLGDQPGDTTLSVRDVATDKTHAIWAFGIEREATAMEVLGAAGGKTNG